MVARTNGMKKGKATNLGTMCARKAYKRSFAAFIFPTKPSDASLVKRLTGCEQYVNGWTNPQLKPPSVTRRVGSARARAQSYRICRDWISDPTHGPTLFPTAFSCLLAHANRSPCGGAPPRSLLPALEGLYDVMSPFGVSKSPNSDFDVSGLPNSGKETTCPKVRSPQSPPQARARAARGGPKA